MKKSEIKKSIQESIKNDLLNEGPGDFLAGVGSGIANAASNVGGQFTIGTMNSKIQRTADRIEKDWEETAQIIAKKAEKLTKARNPSIQQQGQAALRNIDAVNQQVKKAAGQIQQLAKSGVGSQGLSGDDSEDPFKEDLMAKWLKKFGIKPNQINAKMRSDLAFKMMVMQKLGIQPMEVAPQEMDQEILYAQVEQGIKFADAQRLIHMVNSGHMNPEKAQEVFAKISSGKKNKSPELWMGDSPSPNTNPAISKKILKKAPKPLSVPSMGTKAPVHGSLQKLVPGASQPSQTPKPALSKPTLKPRAKSGGTVTQIAVNKAMTNWLSSNPNATPEQKQLAHQKIKDIISGKLADKPQEPQSQQPVELTKLKQYSPGPNPRMEMPPKQKPRIPHEANPAGPSIKPLFSKFSEKPPVKDVGKEIQIGSSSNPAIKPAEDNVVAKPNEKLLSLKKQAETGNPQAIKDFEKALEKDVVEKNKSKGKSKQ